MPDMRRLVSSENALGHMGGVRGRHLDLDKNGKYQIQTANMKRLQQLIVAVLIIIAIIGVYAASILHMKEEHRPLVKTVGIVDRQAVSERLNLTNSSSGLLKHVWNNSTKRFIHTVFHNSTAGLHDALHHVANATQGVLKSVFHGNSTTGIHTAIDTVANATHGVLQSVFHGNSTVGLHSAIHSVANTTHDLLKTVKHHVFGHNSTGGLLHTVWNHSSTIQKSVWEGVDRIMNWTGAVANNHTDLVPALISNASNGSKIQVGNGSDADWSTPHTGKERKENQSQYLEPPKPIQAIRKNLSQRSGILTMGKESRGVELDHHQVERRPRLALHGSSEHDKNNWTKDEDTAAHLPELKSQAGHVTASRIKEHLRLQMGIKEQLQMQSRDFTQQPQGREQDHAYQNRVKADPVFRLSTAEAGESEFSRLMGHNGSLPQ